MTRSTPPTPYLVIDLETRPNPAAAAIAPRGGARTRTSLHEIAAYSRLSMIEDSDGHWHSFNLASLAAPEFDILMEIEAELSSLAERGGTLVTYNGRRHDAGVLRQRAASHWMFGLTGFAALDTLAHRDLMREVTHGWRDSWPSLRDACAGYGIPTDHMLTGRDTPLPIAIRKSQVDCVATFLLLLYELAIDRGDESVLVAGWTALAAYLGEPCIKASHLSQFRWHPHLADRA